MDRTSARLGGIVLLLAAVGGIVGGLLHGPQPGTLEAYAEVGAGWTASHVAIALAGTLLAVGALFLARHFADSEGEGWALVGTGTLLLAGLALLAVGSIETTGFSALLGGAEGGSSVAAEHGFLAASSVMTSLAGAAGYLIPVAVAAFSVAMLKGEGWPGWLAWAGVVIGAAALALHGLGITVPGAAELPLYVLNAWFAVVGVILFTSAGPAAPEPGPAREEPPREEGARRSVV